MPKEPSWLQKLSFVRLFVANGCETTLMVYLETGGKALDNLFMSLLSFGMDDIVRSIFRPQGLRSKRHGRKGRKGGKGNPAIPEVSDMIADRVPGKEQLHKRSVSDGVKHLWQLDGIGQRLLYNVMIVNLVTDFAFDWQSGIVQHEDSDCSGIARMLRNDGANLIGNQPFFGTISVDDLVFIQGLVTGGSGFQDVPEGTYLCTFSMKVKNNGSMFTEPQCRIGTDNDALGGWGYSSRPILGSQSTGELLASATITGPVTIRWQARAIGQVCESSENKVWINQIG